MSEAVTLFISLVGPIMIDALIFFFFQAEDGIRDDLVTGVQTVLFRSGGEDFSDARLKSKSSPPDNSAFPKTPKNLSPSLDRKSVVKGKSVDLGGRRIIKKKKTFKPARPTATTKQTAHTHVSTFIG